MYEIGAGGVSTGTRRKKSAVSGGVSSAKATRQVSTAVKAVSKLSRAASSATKYVRKLTKSLNTLCSFDEVNRLNKITTTKKSTGSGGRSSSRRSSGRSQTKNIKWLERLKKLLAQVGKRLEALWKLKKWKVPESVSELVKLGKQLAELLVGGLKQGYENVLKPIGQWTLQEGLPALVEALGGAFELVTAALELLSPIGEAVWNNFLQPLGQWAGNAAVTVLKAIGGGFSALAEQVKGLAGQLKDGSVIELLAQAGGGLAELLGNGILSGLSALGSKISQWFGEKVASPIKNKALKVGIALAKTPAQLWKSFQKAWGNNRAVQAAVKLLKKGWKTVRAFIGKIPSLISKLSLKKKGWKTVRAFIGKIPGLISKLSLKKKGWKTLGKFIGSVPSLTSLVKLKKSGWKTLSSFIGTVKKTIGLKLTWVTSGLGTLKKAVAKALFGSAKWPKLSFAAQGGVVDAAALFGSTVVGEAGAEAIMPLERNTGWMDVLADRLAQRMNGGSGGASQDIRITVELDGRKVGQSVVRYCNGVARRTGTHPMSAYL